tara:strand:- start:462 stop:671 length:210 start_codon:yes stop_codon:yes gene_type:complete
MALSEKERLDKLLKARTPTDFYDLYEEIFKEEFPIVATLDPDEKIEMIAKAIQKNEKVKELKLAENTNI